MMNSEHKPYEIVISIANKNGIPSHFTMFASCENRINPRYGIPDGVELIIQVVQRKSGTLKWIEKVTPLEYQELLCISEFEPFTAKIGISGDAEFKSNRYTAFGEKQPLIPKQIVSQDEIIFDGLRYVYVTIPGKSISELSLHVMAQNRSSLKLEGKKCNP